LGDYAFIPSGKIAPFTLPMSSTEKSLQFLMNNLMFDHPRPVVLFSSMELLDIDLPTNIPF
jgi:hypothetical protein